MARRREADRAFGVPVEECTFDEVYPLMLETNLHEPRRHDAGGRRGERRRSSGVRRTSPACAFFVARVDGVLAGFCELYVHDGVAEIDDVHTLERFRGRGIARAVVGRTVREGARRGSRPHLPHRG